jgi:hypothetical protein
MFLLKQPEITRQQNPEKITEINCQNIRFSFGRSDDFSHDLRAIQIK